MSPSLPSRYHSTDFMVHLYEKASFDGGGFIETLTVEGTSYSQKINSFGGEDQCQFNLVVHEQEIPDWLNRGLGRLVRVTDPALGLVWHGFINEISVKVSGLDYKIGPLTGITNKLRVLYTPQQTQFNPPVVEEEQVTDWGYDIDSRNKFGTIEETISASGASLSTALAVRQTWLNENAWPAREGSYTGSDTGYSLSVSCLGAQHTLNFYTYTNTLTTASSSPSGEIIKILNANPNFDYISSDRQFIREIPLYVYTYQDTGVKGLDAIRGYIEVGSDAGSKTLFWIDQEGVPHYDYAPTQPKYFTDLRDAARRIYLADGVEIPPWRIRPGEWIQYTDLPITTTDQNLAKDPRNFFIESVAYSMPYGLQLNGSSIKTITQKLASLSLMSNRQ